MEVLTFDVDRHHYAISVNDVREVVRASAIVPLPDAPPVIQGVIDYRGRVIPVFDLRVRFGAPRRPVQPDEHFIVIRAADRVVALRADRAVGLERVEESNVQPRAAVSVAGAYVAGLATLEHGVVLIADAHAFLSESESALLAAALSALPDDAFEARRG